MYGYRHTAFMTEKREAISAKEQGIKVRPTRNHSQLPNPWDDIPCSRRSKTSWKDNTKARSQYLRHKTKKTGTVLSIKDLIPYENTD